MRAWAPSLLQPSYLIFACRLFACDAPRHQASPINTTTHHLPSHSHQEPLRYFKESESGRFRMAIYSHLKLLFTAGSLLTAAVANPLNKRFDDDDDDTPLPLVIWHGERLSPQMDQNPLNDMQLQDWATTLPPKASEASAPSPRPSTQAPSSTTCTSATTPTPTRAPHSLET